MISQPSTLISHHVSQGKCEPYPCAVLVTLGADLAAVRLDQLLDYCQADARATRITGARTVRPEKAFKQVRNIVCGDHRAAVGNNGLDAVPGPQTSRS